MGGGRGGEGMEGWFFFFSFFRLWVGGRAEVERCRVGRWCRGEGFRQRRGEEVFELPVSSG